MDGRTNRRNKAACSNVSSVVWTLLRDCVRVVSWYVMMCHFFLSCLQQTVSALQSHILGFTQRLHSVEVDRRSLRLELSKSKQETSELKNARSSTESQHRKAKEEARGLEERLQEMKEEVRS